jgi:beta-glucosidase
MNVSAVVKHYVSTKAVFVLPSHQETNNLQAAFASPEQGLNTGPVHGGERELRSLYLPSFKRAIIDGGATTIMSSYNSYDGVPVVADSFLLTDVLRTEWGYQYFVISDAGGTARLDNAFHVCAAKDDECITLKVDQARPPKHPACKLT